MRRRVCDNRTQEDAIPPRRRRRGLTASQERRMATLISPRRKLIAIRHSHDRTIEKGFETAKLNGAPAAPAHRTIPLRKRILLPNISSVTKRWIICQDQTMQSSFTKAVGVDCDHIIDDDPQQLLMRTKSLQNTSAKEMVSIFIFHRTLLLSVTSRCKKERNSFYAQASEDAAKS
ncbi:hypothetical protein EVAR_54969_1 [Eumeta japonica]|uniref:Uncharacterized protein n=1 Tax=Eumeta variegata TaxID=151549 RepID=A0A4C1YMZ4_EUMVA|nr:hypothetical protein EVAR_54969_1 [Eumeta japonica]